VTAMELMYDDPTGVGFSPERLSRIDTFVESEIAAKRLPGAVVGIVRGGRLAYHAAYGYRDGFMSTPMTTDTLFWIASMTKPITAVAALTLVEQGLLVLDAELGEYLPQFADMRVAHLTDGSVYTRAAGRQPTILDLMRHTAGIPEGLLGDTPVHALYAEAVGDGMTDLTGGEFADRLSRLPLLHEPGVMWHYGWGFDLLGLLIEGVTGMRLAEYLLDYVFRPLGMQDTTFGVPVGERHRYAAAFDQRAMLELSLARFDSGGAGLVSTAVDYLRFVQMLLDRGKTTAGHLLGRKTVEEMLADQLDDETDVRRLHKPGWNPGYGFGLGLAVRRRLGAGSGPGSVGEVTWPGAAGTNWWADPREDLGVVFFAHTPSGIQTRYQQVIKTLVLQALVS
jgi:CubicO group peptidase (beta-lactamase class C family)